MKNKSPHQLESASFRDPSGNLFWDKDTLYRTITQSYQEHYNLLMSSGLYQKLIEKKLLVPHQEQDHPLKGRGGITTVIKPEFLPFISYPYEWCFSQLKDAALTTLRIQKIALKHGMTLKDASAYNIQFSGTQPLLIDTLSFERYTKGAPWVAYRQFCQHFLAPLALMSYRDIRLGTLSQLYVDGIPLDLTSRLLPRRTRGKIGLLTHIHIHSAAQKRYSKSSNQPTKTILNQTALLGILDSLEQTIKGLTLPKQQSEWGDYYQDTNYSQTAFAHKQEVVLGWVQQIQPKRLWDVGANTGEFSKASAQCEIVLSTDKDALAVEYLYRKTKGSESLLLPLVIDLTNPTPGIGWQNLERLPFSKRCQPDLTLALALIHHIAISTNVPLPLIAQQFANMTKHLIIEFIPKEDSQVQRLLATRHDIFKDYDQPHFEEAFDEHFTTIDSILIKESKRRIYLMKRK